MCEILGVVYVTKKLILVQLELVLWILMQKEKKRENLVSARSKNVKLLFVGKGKTDKNKRSKVIKDSVFLKIKNALINVKCCIRAEPWIVTLITIQ